MDDAAEILRMWGSGFVNRWHRHPDPRLRNAQDLTAAHAQRVALLYVLFWVDLPDKPKQPAATRLLGALLHDAPEVDTGDMSYTFKQANPDVRGWLEDYDRGWFDKSPFAGIEVGDDPLLKLCDHLDSVLFVARHAPEVLREKDWVDQIADDVEQAAALGIKEPVNALLRRVVP